MLCGPDTSLFGFRPTLEPEDMTCIDLFVQLSARNQFPKMSRVFFFKVVTCLTLNFQMLEKNNNKYL